MSDSGAQQAPSVDNLSIGAFSIVMGIGGLSAAFNRAAEAWAAHRRPINEPPLDAAMPVSNDPTRGSPSRRPRIPP